MTGPSRGGRAGARLHRFIFVIKAGEVYKFKNIGDEPLVQVEVHLSPRFIQENL